MKKFLVILCVLSLLVSVCAFSVSAQEILSAPESDDLTGLAWLSNTKPILGNDVSTLSLPAPSTSYNSNGFLTGYCYGQLGCPDIGSDFTQITFRFLGPSWPSPSVIYSLGNVSSPAKLYVSLFLGAFFHNFSSSSVDVSISYDLAYIRGFKSSTSGISLSDSFVSSGVSYTVLVVSSTGDISNVNAHSGNPSVPSSVSVPSGSTLIVCADQNVSTPESISSTAVQASINSLSLVPSTLVSLSQYSISSGSGLPVNWSGLSSSGGFSSYPFGDGDYNSIDMYPTDFTGVLAQLSRFSQSLSDFFIFNASHEAYSLDGIPYYTTFSGVLSQLSRQLFVSSFNQSQLFSFLNSSNFGVYYVGDNSPLYSVPFSRVFEYLTANQRLIAGYLLSLSSNFSASLSPVVSGLSSVSSAVSSAGSDVSAAVKETTSAVQSNTSAVSSAVQSNTSAVQEGNKTLEDILTEVEYVPPMEQFETDYLDKFGDTLDTVEGMIDNTNKALPNNGDSAGFLSDMSSGLLGNSSDVSMSDISSSFEPLTSSPSDASSPWHFFSEETASAMATQDAVGASDYDFDWENDMDEYTAQLKEGSRW